MPKVVLTDSSGRSTTVDAPAGQSVMRAAVNNGVDGILGDCGGVLACATCHAYVDSKWVDRLPVPAADEAVMIECAIDPQPNSRLTCQIVMNDDLDGLELTLPEDQY